MSGVTVLARRNPPRRQAFFRRLRADIAYAQSLRQYMTLTDARPLHDPLVAGFHQFFEVLIGQHAGRNVGAERCDLGAPAHHGANGKAQWFSPCGANWGCQLRLAAQQHHLYNIKRAST
jgi:hypothetical protein